jgi:hypothetical protein
MILIDYSQMILATAIVGIEEHLKTPDENAGNMIKHMFFNTLLSYKKKFGAEYGEIVFCCDDRKRYWRTDIFPSYKGTRKKEKEKSKIDFDFVYSVMEDLKADLRENFRYKVLTVSKAEADDVIAVLSKWSQSNQLKQDGLFDSEPQKMLLISDDTDFYQLQKYKKLRQYAPRKKKFISPDTNAAKYLREHIATGDTGDNIPSIMSPDAWADARALGVPFRAPSLYKALLEKCIESGRDGCENEEQKKHWDRNVKLIDFDHIPEDVQARIVDAYIHYEKKGSQMKVMSYFSKRRFKQLLQSVSDF